MLDQIQYWESKSIVGFRRFKKVTRSLAKSESTQSFVRGYLQPWGKMTVWRIAAECSVATRRCSRTPPSPTESHNNIVIMNPKKRKTVFKKVQMMDASPSRILKAARHGISELKFRAQEPKYVFDPTRKPPVDTRNQSARRRAVTDDGVRGVWSLTGDADTLSSDGMTPKLLVFDVIWTRAWTSLCRIRSVRRIRLAPRLLQDGVRNYSRKFERPLVAGCGVESWDLSHKDRPLTQMGKGSGRSSTTENVRRTFSCN
ncbi:hypothetical protein CC78DRAFT_580472 [Lojkania enalia]|uniref:Uncharacterized protein n=1 Tax=Lojkania enalia TaxID=147567 RepID=A0A9P4N472_9PLEO|nr:hypothetical protein CC78DRAFT_580472 [Didymosphaeria enalia]